MLWSMNGVWLAWTYLFYRCMLLKYTVDSCFRYNNNLHFNAIILSGRVNNFCSNSLSPFLLIIHILSSEAILIQIFLYALFPRFPLSTFLPFPSYFTFHNLRYFGIDVSTHDMTIPPQVALNYHIKRMIKCFLIHAWELHWKKFFMFYI